MGALRDYIVLYVYSGVRNYPDFRTIRGPRGAHWELHSGQARAFWRFCLGQGGRSLDQMPRSTLARRLGGANPAPNCPSSRAYSFRWRCTPGLAAVGERRSSKQTIVSRGPPLAVTRARRRGVEPARVPPSWVAVEHSLLDCAGTRFTARCVDPESATGAERVRACSYRLLRQVERGHRMFLWGDSQDEGWHLAKAAHPGANQTN